MRYDFLIETYETERIKVISALEHVQGMTISRCVPTRDRDPRGRKFPRAYVVHQCVSEDIWFRTMLDIDVGAPPLPKQEVRLEFIRQYEEDSGKRLMVTGEQRLMRRGGKARLTFSTCGGRGRG